MNAFPTHSLLRAPSSRRGALLIECLIYIAVIAVVLGMAFSVLRVGTDNYVGLRRNADDITRVLRAGERWRQDIRRATGAVRFAEDEHGPYVIIPQAAGEVAYQYGAGSVWRFASPEHPAEELVPRVRRSVMASDARSVVTGYRWLLELEPNRKGPRVKPRFAFLAVPVSQPNP
jgi:hypothetical protein